MAISAAILTGLGFPPLLAAGASLIANTVPAAFGALATPLRVLHEATLLDAVHLGARTLGLVFAGTGRLSPFFAAWLGWWGVVLTGNVASSNALFGGLQGVAAHSLEMPPDVLAAVLNIGGAMGGPAAAPGLIAAATTTQQYGQAGRILRYVFWHSIVLAALAGIEALLVVYAMPFTSLRMH